MFDVILETSLVYQDKEHHPQNLSDCFFYQDLSFAKKSRKFIHHFRVTPIADKRRKALHVRCKLPGYRHIFLSPYNESCTTAGMADRGVAGAKNVLWT